MKQMEIEEHKQESKNNVKYLYMVRIEKLKKPDLQTVEMNCANVISKRLSKYPMVQEEFGTTSFNTICGRMGSRKPSLLTSLVKAVFRKRFHSIYLFMPANSRASIENDIYGKNLPEIKYTIL